jgi:hypothetical protein
MVRMQLRPERASPDPETYNAVFLDQSNEDYVKFILNPESWGGTHPLSAPR